MCNIWQWWMRWRVKEEKRNQRPAHSQTNIKPKRFSIDWFTLNYRITLKLCTYLKNGYMHREWLTTSTRIWPLEFSTFRFYNSIFILALFFLLFANKFYCLRDTDLLVLLQFGLIHKFFFSWCCCGGFYRIPALSSRHNCNVYTETYRDHAICLQSLCASIARIFCGQQNAIIRSVLLLLLLLLLLRFLSICFFLFQFL